jgi:GNAT superfamily N-acetyltransferase
MPSRRPKAKETEALLSVANALDKAAFARYLPQEHSIASKDGQATYPWTFSHSQNLSSEELESCFGLIEETSSADYRAASQGWHPEAKRKEMLETDMRYIVLRAPEESNILAFTSFMLTSEEDEAVVYIYEIHLSASLRGTGVGKSLIELVESIGRAVGVQMSMLTVFTANKHAEAFYRHLGYSDDASSPQVRKFRGGKVKRPEYLILSKDLHHSATTKRRKF